MKEAARRWMEQARYDLETARAMLDAERHLYVLFCCQQAIEKALKAIIVERSGELPPRTHNLARLAESAGIAASDEQGRLHRQLTAYYVQSRYPDQIRASGAAVSPETAKRTLEQTESEVQCLLSKLT